MMGVMLESKTPQETATDTSQDVRKDSSRITGNRWRIFVLLITVIISCCLSLILWEEGEILEYFPSVVAARSESRGKIGGEAYPIGRDYFFWDGTSNICTLIQNVTGVATLGDEPQYIAAKQPPPIVNLTVDCEKLLTQTGNWLTVIYHMRLAAALGRVDFQFQCSTGMASVANSMLPWFSGHYPAPSNGSTWPYDFGWPDPKLVCSNQYKLLPLQHLAHEMQHDMRRIAVAMLGPRHNMGTSGLNLGSLIQSIPNEFLNQQDVEIDDAAIHFRCGDVFGFTRKTQYGVIQFREYVKRIPKATTRTIGIHTQPFDVSLLRYYDKGAANSCKKVVGVLVDYLQTAYPNATITVRNTKNDTIPLTYARLTMGAKTITSTSSFGIYPSIGTFGEGYFQQSRELNIFAANVSDILSNLHAMDGPMMSSPEIAKAGFEHTIKFLTEPP
jgi:hypothetical protein